MLLPLVSAAALVLGQGQALSQEPDSEKGVEPQARGPVHEAFAQPMTGQVEEPDIAPREPPDPVTEMPPEEKPEGNNVQWIPGYWDWDEEQEDFLWVSGFWRDAPPDRHWVPGHWQEVENGWQWVRGFWSAEDEDELQYVPPPPPSLEAGPSTTAPEEDMIYVPGCWVYQDERFLWRPGYWVEHRPGWVWVPCHYVQTPGGCLHVKGYWDYPLHERGLLFAPVRIDRQLLTARWTYSPSYVVRPDFLISALFVRPAARCYYFGDYFDERVARRGFVPWVDYRVNNKIFDQNFAFYRHAFQRHDGWEDSLRQLYAARRAGEVPRPPRTLTQQAQVIKNITNNKVENTVVHKNVNITNAQNVTVLRPLKEVRNLEATGLAQLGRGSPPKTAPPPKAIKVQEVAREQREQERARAERLREVAQQRQKVEQKLHVDGAVPQRPPQPPPQPRPQAKPPALPVPKPPAQHPAAQPPPVNHPRPSAPPRPQMPRPEVRPMPRAEPPRPVNPPRPKPPGRPPRAPGE